MSIVVSIIVVICANFLSSPEASINLINKKGDKSCQKNRKSIGCSLVRSLLAWSEGMNNEHDEDAFFSLNEV